MTMPRVEVITSVERRRRWSRAEKERLVAASFEPNVTASEVARSAGIHVSQLFRWRKDLCDRVDPSSTQLVPVEIAPATSMPAAVEEPTLSASPGRRRRNRCRHLGRRATQTRAGSLRADDCSRT